MRDYAGMGQYAPSKHGMHIQTTTLICSFSGVHRWGTRAPNQPPTPQLCGHLWRFGRSVPVARLVGHQRWGQRAQRRRGWRFPLEGSVASQGSLGFYGDPFAWEAPRVPTERHHHDAPITIVDDHHDRQQLLMINYHEASSSSLISIH